jgi:MFS family permease
MPASTAAACFVHWRATKRSCVVAAYALFIIAEYSVRIAMLVFAYSRGGATIAGLVALAQLVPAAVLAPVFSAIADRRSPVALLACGYLTQAVAMGATAVAVAAGVPLAAYAAAIVASTAVTTSRPAQSALIPALSVTPDQLTAANVVLAWVEAAAITLAGLLTGAMIALGGVAVVFGVCAGLGAGAVALAATLRDRTHAWTAPGDGASVLAGLGESLRSARPAHRRRPERVTTHQARIRRRRTDGRPLAVYSIRFARERISTVQISRLSARLRLRLPGLIGRRLAARSPLLVTMSPRYWRCTSAAVACTAASSNCSSGVATGPTESAAACGGIRSSRSPTMWYPDSRSPAATISACSLAQAA